MEKHNKGSNFRTNVKDFTAGDDFRRPQRGTIGIVEGMMRKQRQDRGVVLILTLMLLSILIVVVAQITTTTSLNKHISRNYTDDLQNTYALRSGYHIASLYLLADKERSADADSLHEPWAQPITREVGSSTLTVTVEDEERRINLSGLVKADGTVDEPTKRMLTRLVVNLGYDEKNAAAIIDYIDPDLDGDHEEGARNGPLINKEELLQIKTIENGVLYGKTTEEGASMKGIMEFVTLWPRKSSSQPSQAGGGNVPAATPAENKKQEGKKEEPKGDGKTPAQQPQQQPRLGLININTAPQEVLMALSDKIDATIAGNIVAWREETISDGGVEKPRAFGKVEEIQQAEGITAEIYQEIRSLITVKSNTFSIICSASGGSLRKQWISIVQRTANDPKHPVNLLASQRFQESPSLPEPEQPEE